MRPDQAPTTLAHDINEAHGSSDVRTFEELCEKKDLSSEKDVNKALLKSALSDEDIVLLSSKQKLLVDSQILYLNSQKSSVEFQISKLRWQTELLDKKKALSTAADLNILLSPEENRKMAMLYEQIATLDKKIDLLYEKIDLSTGKDVNKILLKEKDKEIVQLGKRISHLDMMIALSANGYKQKESLDAKIDLLYEIIDLATNEDRKKEALLCEIEILLFKIQILLDEQISLSAYKGEVVMVLDDMIALQGQLIDVHNEVNELFDKKIALQNEQIVLLDEEIERVWRDEEIERVWRDEKKEQNALLNEKIALLVKQILLLDEKTALPPEKDEQIELLDKKIALLDDMITLFYDKQTLLAERKIEFSADLKKLYEGLPQQLMAKLARMNLSQTNILGAESSPTATHGLFSHLMNPSKPISCALFDSAYVYVLSYCYWYLFNKVKYDSDSLNTDAPVAEATSTTTHGLFSHLMNPQEPTFEVIHNVFMISVLLRCCMLLFNKYAKDDSNAPRTVYFPA